MRRVLRSFFRLTILTLLIAVGLLAAFRSKYYSAIRTLAETQIKNATSDLINDAIDVNGLLVLGKMVPSRSEGRRAIEQGGVTLDGEKVTDVKALVTKEQLKAGVLIKRGKKSFTKFVI